MLGIDVSRFLGEIDWEYWNNFQDYHVSFYDLDNMYNNFSALLRK